MQPETSDDATQRRPLILHPLLLAMYVVLAPLAENIDIVGPYALRSLLVALAAVAVLLALLRLWLREPLRAGLMASGTILLFATYGHATRLLGAALPLPEGARLLLLAAWLLLAAAWVTYVWKRAGQLPSWNRYLNAVAVILVAFPLYRIVTYTRNTPALREHVGDYRTQMLTNAGVDDIRLAHAPATPLPDIYYVILDGYARGDVLADLYGYDNSAFLDALAQRGFYLPPRSCSNYSETILSLASSLNMAQLVDAPESLRPWVDTDQEEVLLDAFALLLHQSQVAAFLRSQGYEWVVFDSGDERTAVDTADVFAQASDVPSFDAANVFELMLLDTTVWQAYLDLRGKDYVPLQQAFDRHRERVLYSATHLSDYADRPGPQFVFAHIISPHQPYVFGPKGEALAGVDPYTLLDRVPIAQWDPAPYLDQVTFINSLILREVDEILAKSDPDPVIILQADHGGRVWVAPDPPADIRSWLLFANFAAYLLPAGQTDARPSAHMTPVNLFRVLLNRYFAANLPLLPDQSFQLIRRDGHLAFEDACVALGLCEPAGPGETSPPRLAACEEGSPDPSRPAP